jgi:hypothetical protein
MATSFIKAMMQYFGKKPGQTLSEFQAELKELSHDDRLYFVREFAKIGIAVEPPVPTSA